MLGIRKPFAIGTNNNLVTVI